LSSRSAQRHVSRTFRVQSIGAVSGDRESRSLPSNASRRFLSTGQDQDRLLVVGSGVAGSAAALIAAQTHQIPVTLLFAGNIAQDCNSNWAQGGIIYRNYDPSSGDSADSLADDIHRAGAGLCVDEAVRKVSEEGPDRVRQLLLNGGPFADVPFDKRPDGELSLCLGESIQSTTTCVIILLPR
jgi:L-aspartate oxidase